MTLTRNGAGVAVEVSPAVAPRGVLVVAVQVGAWAEVVSIGRRRCRVSIDLLQVHSVHPVLSTAQVEPVHSTVRVGLVRLTVPLEQIH